MPEKVVQTKHPLIDSDPHAARVVRYFRPSDYACWAGTTAAFPGALYALELADPTRTNFKTPMRLAGFLGFCGGFLYAYQRSSMRFWGWSENQREQDMDLKELRERAEQGLSLYGESNQPEWVQQAANRNSQWSQLKFSAIPMFNLVHHKYHGTDPATYGVKPKDSDNNS